MRLMKSTLTDKKQPCNCSIPTTTHCNHLGQRLHFGAHPGKLRQSQQLVVDLVKGKKNLHPGEQWIMKYRWNTNTA